MHKRVRDVLEDCLNGTARKPMSVEAERHLESCGECAAELKEFERQSMALRSLRAPADVEPNVGFYARVLRRIDGVRGSSSIWSAFLEPVFGKRLAMASAALVLLLGGYLVSVEAVDHRAFHGFGASASISASASDQGDENTPQERDAVLAKLASFSE